MAGGISLEGIQYEPLDGHLLQGSLKKNASDGIFCLSTVWCHKSSQNNAPFPSPTLHLAIALY
mgnify:CR=1 FL=1